MGLWREGLGRAPFLPTACSPQPGHAPDPVSGAGVAAHGPYVPDVPLAAIGGETASVWREPSAEQQEGRDTAEGGQLRP